MNIINMQIQLRGLLCLPFPNPAPAPGKTNEKKSTCVLLLNKLTTFTYTCFTVCSKLSLL